MTWLTLTLAGAVGAATRYGLSGWVQRRTSSELPIGTATVNLLGAFVLGWAVKVFEGFSLYAVGGFLGGFTTFSTWMVESWSMATAGRQGRRRAVVNLTGMLVAGVALAALGYLTPA